MNSTKQWVLCLAATLASLLGLDSSASAQTMIIGIREPDLGNTSCGAKVTLLVIDSASKTTTYYPTNGVYNFKMPAVPATDKRVRLEFQRIAGNTVLTVDGILGEFTGTQKFDVVLPNPKTESVEMPVDCPVLVQCCEPRRCGLFAGRFGRGRCR